MSSTHHTLTAQNCIDGDTSSGINICHSLDEVGSIKWLEVDLQGMFPISEVKIWNRLSNPNRFDQYSIEIFDATYTSIWKIGPILGDGSATFSHLVTSETPPGQYVRVSQNNDVAINLVEIEVFSPTCITSHSGLGICNNPGSEETPGTAYLQDGLTVGIGEWYIGS